MNTFFLLLFGKFNFYELNKLNGTIKWIHSGCFVFGWKLFLQQNNKANKREVIRVNYPLQKHWQARTVAHNSAQCFSL